MQSSQGRIDLDGSLNHATSMPAAVVEWSVHDSGCEGSIPAAKEQEQRHNAFRILTSESQSSL